jgi:hypothetical protein
MEKHWEDLNKYWISCKQKLSEAFIVKHLDKLNIKARKLATAPKNNNQENKAQVSLIPLDIIIPMLEPAYREGVLKYGNETWRMGFNSKVMYDALMRHLTAWFFHLETHPIVKTYTPQSVQFYHQLLRGVHQIPLRYNYPILHRIG